MKNPIATDSGPARLDFGVTGMTCGACASRLQKTLGKQTGVSDAAVNFALERAEVRYDPQLTDPKKIAHAVQRTGFDVSARETDFGIDGMTCSACANRVQKVLQRVPGVLDASVNFALERGTIRALPGQVTTADLSAAVSNAGFALRETQSQDEAADAEEHRQTEQRKLRGEATKLILAAVLTAPLVLQMFAMMLGSGLHLPPWGELMLAAPVQIVFGARFYTAAYKALRAGAGNMDVLVVMGTTAAFGYSLYLLVTLGSAAQGQLYFEASAVIITLVLLGKFLEARAKRGTTEAIRQLMSLRPETARIIRDGVEVEVAISAVEHGDVVIIRPGEHVAVDGTIVEGRGELDEALITGESLPVTKLPGDEVTGGSINGAGLLRVRATAVGQDSTLSRIIRLVERAQSGKAQVQRLVDRISEVFVPVVVGLALLTFGAWMVTGNGFETALIAAVSVLVIACPCALGLATPTAIVTGTGAAARAGILIKDVDNLERAHRIDTVIFDKTGTLTEGRPTVIEVDTLGGDRTYLLGLAASAQQGSEHPLGRAVIQAATTESIDLQPPKNFESHTGQGIAAEIGGRRVVIGNATFLDEQGVETKIGEKRSREWQANGWTVVWVAVEDTLAGLLAIADPIRQESPIAVARLNELGIRTVMLSGDTQTVAGKVGAALGIDEASGSVRPEDKAQSIQTLHNDGRVVAMVGDGINDAPALAAADVSIAMGTGTDVAMETAGVTLMRPDPRLVAEAVSVSRATWRKIRQNLFWAFIYNVIGIPLAALGFLSPAIAAAAMALSSVSVVSNSLLLRRWRPRLQN